MSGILHVWPEETREIGPFVEWKAEIEREGAERRLLWYRMPASEAPSLSDSTDAFAIATVFSAMRHADTLHVHGPVSPTLIRNLNEFQTAWSRWLPDRYRIADIRADDEREEPPSTESRAVMAFSGGLDSSFTAWRHTQGCVGRPQQELTAALMVHGFDIPLTERPMFARAAENSRYMLESIGLKSLTMTTNFREFGDDWEDAHGAAIVSALHLLKGSYGSCVVASSHTYDTLRLPWGSNPITDTMLASAHFKVSHDGCGFSRKEKAREVAAWPEAMKRLRVCWEGPEKDRNCGTCLRCVGTAICFAVERKALPESLPVGDLATAIQNLSSRHHLPPASVTRLAELLADAIDARIEAPWVSSLRDLVTQKQEHLSGAHPASKNRLPRQVWRLQGLLNRLAKKIV